MQPPTIQPLGRPRVSISAEMRKVTVVLPSVSGSISFAISEMSTVKLAALKAAVDRSNWFPAISRVGTNAGSKRCPSEKVSVMITSWKAK